VVKLLVLEKKSAWDKIIEKSLDHEKPGEWESKKKHSKTQGKSSFFFGRNILQDFGDPDIFR